MAEAASRHNENALFCAEARSPRTFGEKGCTPLYNNIRITKAELQFLCGSELYQTLTHANGVPEARTCVWMGVPEYWTLPAEVYQFLAKS